MWGVLWFLTWTSPIHCSLNVISSKLQGKFHSFFDKIQINYRLEALCLKQLMQRSPLDQSGASNFVLRRYRREFLKAICIHETEFSNFAVYWKIMYKLWSFTIFTVFLSHDRTYMNVSSYEIVSFVEMDTSSVTDCHDL